MKLRSLVVAVVVLALLSGVAAYLTRTPPATPADARVGQPIAAKAAFTTATKIRIFYDGTTVELVHQPDGAWTIPAYFDMAVDFNKLTQLFEFFTNEKISRLVTTSADTIKRLEFDGTKITLVDAAGKEAFVVSIGKDTDTGGKFIRFGDEQKAFQTDANILLDANPANWADTNLINVKNEDVARVDLDFPAENASFTASRQKPTDPWVARNIPAGKKLDDGAVTRIFGADGNIRFQEVIDPADARATAPRPETRSLRFTTFAGQTIDVSLSRKPSEKIVKTTPAPANNAAKSGPQTLLNGLNPADQKDQDANPADVGGTLVENTPAGPVFVVIKDSDPKARVNALMQKRAFQVQDFTMTSLPEKLDDVFVPASGAK